jgi:hypothetical protein
MEPKDVRIVCNRKENVSPDLILPADAEKECSRCKAKIVASPSSLLAFKRFAGSVFICLPCFEEINKDKKHDMIITHAQIEDLEELRRREIRGN